ncbi:MAG: hypothetical protein MJ118_09290, partial [Clostridia bacterium]|nr:hypothetical protein [Clostridia bacterium]
LKEVSKDKLLILVTHNFEEAAPYATREIRVYDGAIASDHRLTPEQSAPEAEQAAGQSEAAAASEEVAGWKIASTSFMPTV